MTSQLEVSTINSPGPSTNPSSSSGQEILYTHLSAPTISATMQTTPQDQLGGVPPTPSAPRTDHRAHDFPGMHPDTGPTNTAPSPFLPALGSDYVTHRNADEQARRLQSNLDSLRNMTPDRSMDQTRIQNIFSIRPQSTPANPSNPSSTSQARYARMSVPIPQLREIPEVSEPSRSFQYSPHTAEHRHQNPTTPQSPVHATMAVLPAT